MERGKVIPFKPKPAYRREGFAPLPGRRLLFTWGHASQYMLYWDCSIEGSRDAGYTLYDRCYADGLTHSEISVEEYRATNGSSPYRPPPAAGGTHGERLSGRFVQLIHAQVLKERVDRKGDIEFNRKD